MSPLPSSTPSIAELQMWLLDCAIELASLERRISTRGLPGSSQALSVRLSIISLLLPEMREGIALEEWQAKTQVRLIEAALDRLKTEIDAMPVAPPPSDAP